MDEKSDVWALGFLLYKLSCYTTPFEEHGPLAILNVQYKIPPYPVYTSYMITSISRPHFKRWRFSVHYHLASMLQERGAQWLADGS